MIYINKVTSDNVVDYAAEELKKYLSMMMPDCGDIVISYCPGAQNGFRLGYMQDFGLDISDVADAELDDIIYIDTTEHEGVIAGDNSRSVLIAVYEYLRENGCRWLFPGVDGEYIPTKSIKDVKLRHVADHRYRGWCNEGAIYQESIIDMIDFTPKNGMNTCMLQFKTPKEFYDRYHRHICNEKNRPQNEITKEMVDKWTRQCEYEIEKRGLQLHRIGHGFTIEPFGLDSSSMWNVTDETDIPDDAFQYLAMINGKRGLFGGIAINTNFCMSCEDARLKVARYIADYAKKHSNITYLHIWLGDDANNHCECEECSQKIPSDWYMLLMNDIDAALSQNNLDTRIVFIAYLDTSWPPLTEKIKNPGRFTLMLAPITRSYTRGLTDKKRGTTPYVRNKLTLPADLDEYFEYFDEWKKVWNGANLCYEYHFWSHQYRDPSTFALAERIYDDIRDYKSAGIDGIIQCGSQRSFFPNGYAYYVYARSLFDMSISIEDIREDYFSHAYGKEYKKVLRYFEEVRRIFDMSYLEGEKSVDLNVSKLYNPSMATGFSEVKEIVASIDSFLKREENSDITQLISSGLLRYHTIYIQQLAEFFEFKSVGDEDNAKIVLDKFRTEFGKFESEIERYFDHYLAFTHLLYK